MATETLHSKAPTRIDLAGGTLDIWPLYLFLKEPMTLNLGIDLYAEATIEVSSSKTDPGKIKLISNDQSSILEIPWEALENGTVKPPPSLELHFKLLKHFAHQKENPRGQFTLSTKARSPAGAGLGGSSTLSIAMIGALATWAGIDPAKCREKLIEIVRDVETTVIRVPAGLQDYYGAMYGGLQCLSWGAGSHQQESLPEGLLAELEERLLLFYSGQSRNSGINNWSLFKGFIDRTEDDVASKFQNISDATHALRKALQNRDWEAVGHAISKEWTVRKTLAPGITTPEIDAAFSKANQITPLSGKVCGAGGGGCFFVYLSDPKKIPDLKSKIIEAFSERGIQSLPFHAARHGLEVHVTKS